ncbi:CDP-alcohol phosphatidyltransferase family protein [Tardibacter chloracetimidivorans]|nr:CDP-alcohol phosphatidyltransferase family protein [Tardibacter chloracetimidivorans]
MARGEEKAVMMTALASDGSRDPAIESVSNLWLIHPLSRAGLGWALRRGVSANMVSIAGLLLGIASALAYFHWQNPLWAAAGLLLSLGWLVADGLDGMIARATGTSSAAGRVLDGICDHGVFICIYVSLAFSLGFASWAWLAAVAGLFHAIQSSLYESERARYHRRIRAGVGAPDRIKPQVTGVGLYDKVFHALDRWAAPFDRRMAASADPPGLARHYREAARPPMKLMSLLSSNARAFTVFLAAVAGDPRLFWWFQIGPLTLVAILAIFWHRWAENRVRD